MMDPRVVFVKTVVYHALGTLMPYPFEDPPWRISVKRFSPEQLYCSSLCPCLVPLGEGGIHYISPATKLPRHHPAS